MPDLPELPVAHRAPASGPLPAGRRLRHGLRAGARLLLALVLTYLGLLAVTFFIGRVIPVDPVLAIVGDHAPEHVVARVREDMGLNKPLYVQFGIYLHKVAQGDFGTSVLTANPVMQDIARAFPATLELATAGILIGVLVRRCCCAASHHRQSRAPAGRAAAQPY